MVPLKEGDAVFGEAKLKVTAATGEYADYDLIECAESGKPACVFQAQYIKYGPVVYQHNTPEELGAALFAVDPESTHDAVLLYKEDEARRIARTKGTLEPSEPVPAPDSPVAEEEKKEREKPEEPAQEEPEPEAPPEETPAPEEVPVEPTVEEPAPDDGSVLGEALVPPEGNPFEEAPVVEEVPASEPPAPDLSATNPE